MTDYRTAEEAIKSGSGAKKIANSFSEAFKLTGKKTKDVSGNDRWFSVPHRADHRNARLWAVALSSNEQAAQEEVGIMRKKHPELFV